MFRQVNVPVLPPFHFPPPFHNLKNPIQILGMIQNMSTFTCPACSHTVPIFSPHSRHGGGGGVEHACTQHGIPFLGDIPLHASICDDADRGMPTVVAEPAGSERVEVFMKLAEKVGGMVGL